MNRDTRWLWFTVGLILAGCSPQSDQDAMTAKIAESIRHGEAAAEVKPGYGFDLYPGAVVTSSLLDGMSLTIRTEASFETIVAFYERQMVQKGWQIESRTLENGKASLKGDLGDDSQEKMSITLARAKRGPDLYQLVFIKYLADK